MFQKTAGLKPIKTIENNAVGIKTIVLGKKVDFMKIIFIRHGEPDYSIDSLTEKGWREAEMVGERLKKVPCDVVFCSPLGRAKDTMKPYLEKTGKDFKICDWLEEFAYEETKFIHPETGEEKFIWDFTPDFLDRHQDFFDREKWAKQDFIEKSTVFETVTKVFKGFDDCLKEFGYERCGTYYKVNEENHKTIMFFCHFGIEALLLSHLFNCSPQVISHNFIALPSSVTTLITEEREKGKAYFRCQQFGDISHLYKNDEPVSFAGRFCECFSDPERHNNGD